ncbi:MAG: hypothetical protein RL274_2536, partial [Pseudomonadota bacterium]
MRTAKMQTVVRFARRMGSASVAGALLLLASCRPAVSSATLRADMGAVTTADAILANPAR